MKKLNINICESYPKCQLQDKSVKEDNYQGYFELLVNANSKKLVPSEVFKNRMFIINHSAYPYLKISQLWDAARQAIDSDETPHGLIWKEILNSRFMYDIIMHGAPMNDMLTSAFKKFIDSPESIELLKTKLLTISFMFSSNCIKKDIQPEHKFDYPRFSWVSSLITNQ